MDLSAKKKTAAQRENANGSLQDLRNRIEGDARFRRAWSGYQCRQVDDYLREQSAALTRERQEHSEQLAALRQEIEQQKELAAGQQEQQAAAQQQQEQIDSLSAALLGKEEQLRESEAELALAQQGGAEAQRLTQQVRELSAENLRLVSETNQLRCQLAARDQLADQLRQKNRELETAAEQVRQQLLAANLSHTRGLDGVRAVQNDCTATLSSQLHGCLELLERYQQEMDKQVELVMAQE